jgi:hypothetical protein
LIIGEFIGLIIGIVGTICPAVFGVVYEASDDDGATLLRLQEYVNNEMPNHCSADKSARQLLKLLFSDAATFDYSTILKLCDSFEALKSDLKKAIYPK